MLHHRTICRILGNMTQFLRTSALHGHSVARAILLLLGSFPDSYGFPDSDTRFPRKATSFWKSLHLFDDNFRPASLILLKISSNREICLETVVEKQIMSSTYTKQVVQD